MTKRYNIVLLPSFKHSNEFINYAASFSSIANQYILGKKSLPHITVCQFEIEKNDIKKVHEINQQLMQITIQKRIFPEFTSLNFVSLEGEFSGMLAVDLGIKRNEPIMLLHQKVTALLESLGFTVLNAKGDLYRPHLTLTFLSYKNNLHSFIFPKKLMGPSKEPFSLCLGTADLNWQLTGLI